jgi:hypothetical protein
LITRAESDFDVLLTMDVGFASRLDLANRDIAVILIRAPSNRLADTQPLMATVLAELETIEPGDVTIIS